MRPEGQAAKIAMTLGCNLVQVTCQINMLRCCVNLEKLTTAYCLKEWLLWATIILNNSCDKEDRTGHRPHTNKRSHMTEREHCPLHPHLHVNVCLCLYIWGALYWPPLHSWGGWICRGLNPQVFSPDWMSPLYTVRFTRDGCTISVRFQRHLKLLKLLSHYCEITVDSENFWKFEFPCEVMWIFLIKFKLLSHYCEITGDSEHIWKFDFPCEVIWERRWPIFIPSTTP